MATLPRYYKHNRLQQLRAFVTVVEAGSISRAADVLMLSQPSVSLQVQALEREFGAAMFERRGPKLNLTHDGKLLYQLVAPLVRDIDNIHKVFDARREGVEAGRLDVAAGGSTIMYLLPSYVATFCELHPRIDLKLHNVTGRDGLARIRADEVDFAVGSMVESHPDMEYEPLFAFDAVLIAAQDHPLAARKNVTLKQVAQYPLILPPSHLTTWGVIGQVFEKHGLHPNIKLEVGGWEVIKKFVTLNLGVSIVTSICLNPADALTVIPMDRYFPKRTYGIVWRKGKVFSPQALRFADLLREGARSA